MTIHVETGAVGPFAFALGTTFQLPQTGCTGGDPASGIEALQARGALVVFGARLSGEDPQRPGVEHASRITTGANASHVALPGLTVDVEPDCPPYLWTFRGMQDGMPVYLGNPCGAIIKAAGELTGFQDGFFFAGNLVGGTTGHELWHSDGTAAGTIGT